MKIFTVADVPDRLTKTWLQHLRDFDAKHPGCHFEVMADAPEATLTEIVDMIQLAPALTFTKILERKP
jgi:hypothetical protein